jgi:hypothetical protein
MADIWVMEAIALVGKHLRRAVVRLKHGVWSQWHKTGGARGGGEAAGGGGRCRRSLGRPLAVGQIPPVLRAPPYTLLRHPRRVKQGDADRGPSLGRGKPRERGRRRDARARGAGGVRDRESVDR